MRETFTYSLKNLLSTKFSFSRVFTAYIFTKRNKIVVSKIIVSDTLECSELILGQKHFPTRINLMTYSSI